MIKRPLFWLSLPLLLPQGLWVKRTARRLPPAAGPISGAIGRGPTRRLLLVGDSIIAGVGVEQLVDALPGQLARALAERHRCRIEWHAHGDNGASCADLSRQLPSIPAIKADWIFLSVGVNDVTRLTTTRAWRQQLTALLTALTIHSPNASVLLAGVPPMARFPRCLGSPPTSRRGCRHRCGRSSAGAPDASTRSANKLPRASTTSAIC